MILNRRAFVVAVFFCFFSCINKESNKKPPVDPDSIYFDYLAWGDEETKLVTFKLQYRAGGPEESAILVKAPARVEFDGQPVLPDSSKFNGPYYEIIRPLADFNGRHQIVYIDASGQSYTTTFEFPVITLKTPLDSMVKRADMRLELNGLNSSGKIRVMLTDTAFYGRGFERIVMPDSNLVIISRKDLSRLHNGPVQLEFLREEDRDPEETMSSGGRFYMTYSLKREFTLLDSSFAGSN